MKKKILSVIVSLALAIGFCGVVNAEETISAANYIDLNRVEQLYYDENGNMVVVFRDDLITAMMDNESVTCSEVCDLINPWLKASDTETVYTSTLGPENDARELWAQNSVNNTAIEEMWIQCDAYYTTGTHIATVVEESDPRYTYQIMTAKVKVPDSPFDSFRVGSGLSDHVYRDSRFQPVTHHLTWNVY